MALQIRIGMPMEEFIRLYDAAPFELLEGERMPLVPTVAGHGEALKSVYGALFDYERTSKRVVVYSELPFVLTDTPDWVTGARVPDVMVYAVERMAAYKAKTSDWQKKPFVLVPDLCVEVISPNDSYLDVEEKVDRYFEDGVRLVWVVNPRKNIVSVYSPGSSQITRLSENDTLDGGDVLPGFMLPVRDIFPK